MRLIFAPRRRNRELTQIYVANPAFMQLSGPEGSPLYGCDQDWFRGLWQRKAGCGPCTLSNIMLYLARAGKLPQAMSARDEQGMLPIMETMWNYVTPGAMGLNSTARFAEGADRALKAAGSPLRAVSLDIEKNSAALADRAGATDFIASGLRQAPVAFLSLLRRQLGPLEPWHWVTVAGLSRDADDAVLHIYDNGHAFDLSLAAWLDAGGGGGFVALK